MKPVLVHAPGYDLSLFGLDRLPPFDGRKFSRAWRRVREQLGERADRVRVQPDQGVSDAELASVHGAAYLDSLSSPAVVAQALEIAALKFMPRGLLRSRVLEPMRLATAGTLLATVDVVHVCAAAVA